jgi:predicted nicotinamide N-methyase
MNFPLQLQVVELDGTSVSLYVPLPESVQEAYQHGKIDFPFWSQVWPSAKALASFILQFPHYVGDKEVLEIAAGLGLPSIVAAGFAKKLTCTEYAGEALPALRQSAAGLPHVHVMQADWNQLPPHLSPDVLLLSDINYDPTAFEQLKNVIHHFLQKGTVILLSTPQRLMAKPFIEPLLHFCIQQETINIEHQSAIVPISVLVLRA